MHRNNILELLKQLVAIDSTTGTSKEKDIEKFLDNWLHKLPYFQQHPELAGQAEIPQDPYNRKIIYALVKGKSNKTVVFLNHHDVVSTTCFGTLQQQAYNMEKITETLQQLPIDEDAHKDLISGEWLAGRGSNDMKGGMAAQLCFLQEYTEKLNEGSLLFISVPDEESFSWGMRSGISLLKQLQHQHSLEYILCINSEPNRKEKGKQIIPIGSVGKLLPFVFIQGKSTHLSAYEQGINPLGILANLVAATEGSPEFQEEYAQQKTIPPVWLHMRDCKAQYDFSLPDRAVGYCSVQTFRKSPLDVLNLFKAKLESSILNFRQTHTTAPAVPIVSSQELLKQASQKDNFTDWNKQALERIRTAIYQQGVSYPDATLSYLTNLLDFLDLKTPLVILGFAPPYYPATNSLLMGKTNFEAIQKALSNHMPLEYEPYFLGVSDCSYCGLTTEDNPTDYSNNTPLWGTIYNFDMSALGELQLPFLLLGPWGKDLHEITERVNIKSLTEELPKALEIVTSTAWN